MRLRETILFSLLIAGTIFFREQIAEVPALHARYSDMRDSGEWRYDEDAPFHGVLPQAIQQFRSSSPHEAASAVCGAMGGRHLAKQAGERDGRFGFSCVFQERDLTITADFGDLRRSPTPSR